MSLSSEREVSCPKCQAKQRFVLHQSINVTLEPAKKQLVLDGRAWTLSCACGNRTQVAYPMLYHDGVKLLMVQLDPTGDVTAESLGAVPEGYTTRLVRRTNDVVEKVRIADASLDDRAVEVVKLLLAVQNRAYAEAPWYFEAADEASLRFVVLAQGGLMAASAPRAVYDNVVKTMPLGPVVPWSVVDRAFALKVLEARKA